MKTKWKNSVKRVLDDISTPGEDESDDKISNLDSMADSQAQIKLKSMMLEFECNLRKIEKKITRLLDTTQDQFHYYIDHLDEVIQTRQQKEKEL